jgi:hypothetical protein
MFCKQDQFVTQIFYSKYLWGWPTLKVVLLLNFVTKIYMLNCFMLILVLVLV